MASELEQDSDSSFFRYRPISVNSLFEISTSSFYLAAPTTFNDPFDCDFYWRDSSKEEKIGHIAQIGGEYEEDGDQLDILSDTIISFESTIRKDVDELGIACFTTDPESPLMWSHYGDNHKGICIEYKQDGILLNPENFGEVKYDRDKKMVWNSLDFGKDIELLRNFLQDLVFRKLPEWKYEQEWRLMVIRPKERLHYIPNSVLSVTFGLRCENTEIQKVINIFRDKFVSESIRFYWIKRGEDGGLLRTRMHPPNRE